jgi:hypothetical protein
MCGDSDAGCNLELDLPSEQQENLRKIQGEVSQREQLWL